METGETAPARRTPLDKLALDVNPTDQQATFCYDEQLAPGHASKPGCFGLEKFSGRQLCANTSDGLFFSIKLVKNKTAPRSRFGKISTNW